MNILQRAALDRAKDALMFAFSEPMRLDLLAETGIDDVNASLLIDESPDDRLQILLPRIETLRPDQAVALLLTCVQSIINAVEKQSATA